MRGTRLIRAVLSAALIATAVAGCSRVRVVTHSDRHWQHTGLRTYSWKPAPPPLGEPRIDEESLGVAIKKSADATLAEMGYRLAADQPPDFLMAYRLSLGEADRVPKEMDPATADHPAWLQFWENAERVPSRNERSLVIYAVDEGPELAFVGEVHCLTGSEVLDPSPMTDLGCPGARRQLDDKGPIGGQRYVFLGHGEHSRATTPLDVSVPRPRRSREEGRAFDLRRRVFDLGRWGFAPRSRSVVARRVD